MANVFKLVTDLQVLDYKTQQSRLFPLLASAYAFRFVGDWLKWLYMDVTQKREAKDYSTLQEAVIINYHLGQTSMGGKYMKY